MLQLAELPELHQLHPYYRLKKSYPNTPATQNLDKSLMLPVILTG